MNKILIAPKSQYGYNTDYYQMANRLAEKGIGVEVVCFDQGYEKVVPPGNLSIKYVHRTANKAGNYSRHMFEITKSFWRNRKNLNWIVVSSMIELCGILPFFFKIFTPRSAWIMDIRTCSVVDSARKRGMDDFLTLQSARFFDHTTIISELVAKRLKIKDFEVLPLGAECYIELKKKQFDPANIKFLYVGTFDGRRIGDLVRAFDIVCGKLGQDVNLQFDIVGYADNEAETVKVVNEISKSRCKDRIIYHGRKSHAEIHELFQTATIGFSYVPITDFYDIQPPTKTYEYIMNGIICMGTKTKANAAIINKSNGIVTADDVDSLVRGMEYVLDHLTDYDSVQISETVRGSQWEIINHEFYSFLKRLAANEPAEPSSIRGIGGNG